MLAKPAAPDLPCFVADIYASAAALIKLAVMPFNASVTAPKFNQLGKRLVRLFGGGQFDHLPERGGFLAADGRQFAETVGRILFDDAQRIATRDGGMLAGITGQDHPAIPRWARSNSFAMSSKPTAPASSSTITDRDERSTLSRSAVATSQRHASSKPSLRSVSAAEAVGAQNTGSKPCRFKARANSAKRRAFAGTRQPAKAGNRSGLVRTWANALRWSGAEISGPARNGASTGATVSIPALTDANQVKFLVQNVAGGILRPHPHELVIFRQIPFQPIQIQLPTTLNQCRFQNLVLRDDRLRSKTWDTPCSTAAPVLTNWGGEALACHRRPPPPCARHVSRKSRSRPDVVSAPVHRQCPWLFSRESAGRRTPLLSWTVSARASCSRRLTAKSRCCDRFENRSISLWSTPSTSKAEAVRRTQ